MGHIWNMLRNRFAPNNTCRVGLHRTMSALSRAKDAYLVPSPAANGPWPVLCARSVPVSQSRIRLRASSASTEKLRRALAL